MQFLYNIHSIICNCFFDNYWHQQLLYYFHWYLKRRNTYVNASTNTNIKTRTLIYQTYKWEVLKKIDTKNRTYRFFNDMINIEKFDSDLLKIDIGSYKNIDTYYIGYIATKNIGEYESIFL